MNQVIFNGFASGPRSDVEEQCIHLYALKHDIPYKKFIRPEDVPAGWIPVGTVEWFQKSTNWNLSADNYPDFLKHCLKRNVWKQDDWPVGKKVFIKPSDKLKRFNGRVTDGSYKGKKKGPYFCSDIVHFTNEWRYYISHGKILDSAWYIGQDDDIPAPSLDEFNIQWPEYWVGSVDFGTTKEHGLCLIEAHEPFAVGNYLGLNSEVYPEWVIEGWEYLFDKYNTFCDRCKYVYCDCPGSEPFDIRRCKNFELTTYR
jgi:hypothetical protein